MSYTNPDDFALAMTENLRLASSQKDVFKVYMNMYFGESDPHVEINLDRVTEVLKAHPKLSKLPVREQNIIWEEKNHEIPQSLSDFVRSFRNSASRVRNNLFRPHENIVFWRQILDFPKPVIASSLSKEEKRAIKKKDNDMFLEHLSQFIDKDVLKFIKNPSIDSQAKTIFMYKTLSTIRENMIADGKDTRAIAQAMVDLIHTSGFGNTFYTDLLKSKNPKEQLAGVNKILDERDSVALTLGFEGHFPELMRFLNVDHSTGSTKRENLTTGLRTIEKDIENMPYTSIQTSVLRVRSLSIQEAPFRGCLGGSDCSSYTYFHKAFDPNFLYFTITDKHHQSSGQITVVLGTATNESGLFPWLPSNLGGSRNVKIAFVDKIQNVPNDRIPHMLESIRLSLQERGYKLGLPKDMGDNNGLSNQGITRDYVQSEINSKLKKTVFTGFKPHRNKYSFDNEYSRAYEEPELLEFKLVENGDIKIEPGEIKKAQNAPQDLNTQNLFKEALSLQYSEDEEDQIRFINSLLDLREVGGLYLSEPEDHFSTEGSEESVRKKINDDFIQNYLEQKIGNSDSSFKLRKRVLWTLMEFTQKKYYKHVKLAKAFLNNWNTFSEKEQTLLLGEISNWKKSRSQWKQEFPEALSYYVFFNANGVEYTPEYILDPKLTNLLDIHTINSFGDTSLIAAIKRKDTEAAKILIERGVNIHAQGEAYRTALMHAAENPLTEIVGLLIDKGADIYVVDFYNQSALDVAKEEVFHLLKERGVRF